MKTSFIESLANIYTQVYDKDINQLNENDISTDLLQNVLNKPASLLCNMNWDTVNQSKFLLTCKKHNVKYEKDEGSHTESDYLEGKAGDIINVMKTVDDDNGYMLGYSIMFDPALTNSELSALDKYMKSINLNDFIDGYKDQLNF